MRIGIDVSQIIYGTGVSTYTRNLIELLLKIDKENDYVLFGGSLRRFQELKKIAEIGSSEKRIFPFPPTFLDLIWNRLHILPVDNFIGKVDVFHSSDWTQPPTKAYKVTTVHDLAPLRFPSITPKKIIDVHKGRLSWVKKEADKIIAVSEFTKKEIIELLGVDENRVVVIPEAVGLEVKRQDEGKIREVKEKYGIEGKYLLVVGADRRKNTGNIVKAFKKAKDGLLGVNLVIVSKRALKDLEEVGGVVFIGQVSFDELVALYSGAEALVYASFYEGFGLPILEAMKVGCPVVTSNIGAMAETAGNAAVLVDPYDIEDIRGGIEEAIESRGNWISRGLKRVKEFSWERAASETIKVYKRARD